MKKVTNESAVSESIGVILIVALTVIMAAIIASYAFGLVQGIPVTHTVILTLDLQPDGSYMLTYRGGPDDPLLISLDYSLSGAAEPTWTSPAIGESKYVAPGNHHVVVTGHFPQGKDQVVLDTWT